MAVGQFREVERSYFDLRWHLDPVAATQAGVTAHDHRFGRFSPDALAPQAWAAAAPLLALRTLLGLDAVDARLRADPKVPRGLGTIRLRRLRSPGRTASA